MLMAIATNEKEERGKKKGNKSKTTATQQS